MWAGNKSNILYDCKFQDQGGIYIGDDVFIGHNVVLATLDHEIDPDKREIILAPIHIEDKVWIGAGAISHIICITQGLKISQVPTCVFGGRQKETHLG